MSGFSGIWDIIETDHAGRTHFSSFRKTPAVATTAGIWFDFSMSPGNPSPQYYAASPLIAQEMKRSTDGGLNHGQVTTGYNKYLNTFTVMIGAATGLPMPYILCDYLLYYPFVDCSTNDAQLMDNSVSLPRYTDGNGVMMMAVSVASNTPTRPTFVVSYTNSSGVSGRTSRPTLLNSGTVNGSILSSTVFGDAGAQPFIGLQSGDSGVRSVESVTFTSGTDVGLMAIVLVKPLLQSTLTEQTAPVEVDRLEQGMYPIKIEQDAFLCWIGCPTASISTVSYHGFLETLWR